MKEVQDEPGRSYKPLIDNHGYYVLVSHQELDSLIARLMHLAELDSDKEHRDALKGELKSLSRSWLDGLYEEAGYRNYDFVDAGQIVQLAGAPPEDERTIAEGYAGGIGSAEVSIGTPPRE